MRTSPEGGPFPWGPEEGEGAEQESHEDQGGSTRRGSSRDIGLEVGVCCREGACAEGAAGT